MRKSYTLIQKQWRRLSFAGLKRKRQKHPFEPRWIPDFEKTWTKIKLETYKLIYEKASERFQEVLDESESITNKSTRVLVAVSAVIAFSITYLQKDNLSMYVLIPMTIIAIIDFILIVYLLHPRDIIDKGFRPDELIPVNLAAPGDKDHQEQILYYSMVVLIQSKITFMVNHNRSRSRFYFATMILTVVIIVLLMVGVIVSFAMPADSSNASSIIQQ